MARISGVDIPKQKRGVISLTYIYGVGRSRAKTILANAGVNESKKVTGILSERDLSRFIYAEKFNLTLPISELMSKSLVTCDLNTSVTELMDEMTEKKIRHILIMEDKKLLGIVSIGDVVNHLIAKIKEENKNLKDYINSY